MNHFLQNLLYLPTDTIDIVRDPISPSEYKIEEDPRLYHSMKTGRGPLGDDWLDNGNTGPFMCAYKLCKVEFRYWGMQSKIEQFIHDVGKHDIFFIAILFHLPSANKDLWQ